MRSFFLFFLLAQSPDIFISASFLALHHNNVWLFLWGSLIDHCVCFQTAGLVKSLMDHSVRLLGWSKFDGSFCQTAGLVRVWRITVFPDCWAGQSLMDHCVRLLAWSKFTGSLCQTAGLVKVWWILVSDCWPGQSLLDPCVRLLAWSKFDGFLCQTAGLVKVWRILVSDCWPGQSLTDPCVRLLAWSKFDRSLCQTAGLVKVWRILVSDCWPGQSLTDPCVRLLAWSKFDGSLRLFPDCWTWRDRWRRAREVGTAWTAPTLQQPRSSRRGRESWRRKLRSASTKSKECDKNLKNSIQINTYC